MNFDQYSNLMVEHKKLIDIIQDQFSEFFDKSNKMFYEYLEYAVTDKTELGSVGDKINVAVQYGIKLPPACGLPDQIQVLWHQG